MLCYISLTSLSVVELAVSVEEIPSHEAVNTKAR